MIVEKYMKKIEWIDHIVKISGLVPPSQGGDNKVWKVFVVKHISEYKKCHECIARKRTLQKQKTAKERHEALVSLGLKRTRYGYE